MGAAHSAAQEIIVENFFANINVLICTIHKLLRRLLGAILRLTQVAKRLVSSLQSFYKIMIDANLERQLELLSQNVDTLVSRDELIQGLKLGKRLKVKLGIDPTRPDLTFGHMVVFNKMKHFQELGHEVILIIGDYTTLIGDPSGRSNERPQLTREQIEENAKTYLDQVFKVLDRKKTVVRRNSEWFNPMRFEDCLCLARKATVAQMLEREDFDQRYQNGTPISIVEFLYPLLQAYDSVMLEADVELGGSDQLFNLLMGRTLQKEMGQNPQIVITMPLLVGLDGTKKMSKSQNNYIAFNDSPKDMFGKIMSVSDDAMWDYYILLLEVSKDVLEDLKKEHPMAAKKKLASTLVGRFHGMDAAKSELEQFEKVFSKKELPDDMPVFAWSALGSGESAQFVDVLMATGFFPSKKEIKRLMEQGAVALDNEKITATDFVLLIPKSECVIQAGKRTFLKITR
jgi:tyrosyl-tRNA synthetase